MAEAAQVRPDGSRLAITRQWVPEAPVALEFNGLAYAVMMATPADLADFATGFALSEGLAAQAGEVTELAIAEVEQGWIVRAACSAAWARSNWASGCAAGWRNRAAGCAVSKTWRQWRGPCRRSRRMLRSTPQAIFAALGALKTSQPLGFATGASHAAAWADPLGAIHCLREDVGRHNALDKLVGAMAREGRALSPGFVLSTARCSYEIVEKAVRGGATTLVTVSLPTTMAVARAQAAGLSLWVLARDDSVLLVNP